MSTDEEYMQQALIQAQMAFEKDEVPVGAIVVMQNKIISRAYNQVEMLTDSTAHAEILALTSAYQFLGSKYLPEATLYVTIEPCLMCSGALYWSKIGRIVFGAYDEKNGYRKSLSIASPFEGSRVGAPFHPKTEIIGGILENDCAQLMKDFFKARR
ncbi:MAG: nucleoside deaminase [Ferruginibacter sp.]